MNKFEKFADFLKKLPEGEIKGEHESKVMAFLWDNWESLIGSKDTKMETFKLDRVENLKYEPPATIKFDVERHGPTVLGSVYATVQQWTVNVKEGTAEYDPYPRKRLIGQRAKPMNVKPIAQEVAKEIMAFNKESKYLAWKSDKKVRVRIGEIISAGNQQTLLERRRRFRIAI